MTASTTALPDVLAGVKASWEGLLRTATATTRRLRIAEVDVEIVVVGEELAGMLLPAFDGLEDARGEPQATIGAWDAAATRTEFPPRPPGPPNARLRGVVRRNGRPVGEVEWSGRSVLRTGDRDRGLHLLVVGSASVLTGLESSSPLRRQLSWALGTEVLFAHAGAVGGEEGVALLIGPSGAGKSSTALACLRAGMGYMSDDTCLVRGNPPTAYRLDSTARLFDRDVSLFAEDFVPVALGAALGDPAVYSGDEPEIKALYSIHRDLPDLSVGSAPVRVVLLPEPIGDRQPRLIPIRRAEALRRAAPHVLWQTSVEPDRDLVALRELLSAVPCYRLVLSRDRAANPTAVAEALARNG